MGSSPQMPGPGAFRQPEPARITSAGRSVACPCAERARHTLVINMKDTRYCGNCGLRGEVSAAWWNAD